MVIYLDDYRKAQAARVAGPHRYDEEILSVNWNPAVSGLTASAGRPGDEPSHALPEDYSSIDAEAFLTRVYALATQV